MWIRARHDRLERPVMAESGLMTPKGASEILGVRI